MLLTERATHLRSYSARSPSRRQIDPRDAIECALREWRKRSACRGGIAEPFAPLDPFTRPSGYRSAGDRP